MQVIKYIKYIIFSVFLLIPCTISANNQQSDVIDIYSKAEKDKIYDFSLVNEFNIIYFPNQKLSKLLATQISDYLKKEGVSCSVGTTASSTKNIIINNTDIIEGYGRGDNAYRIKVTKNNVIIEFTSSKTLYWAYEALKHLYTEDNSLKTKLFKSRAKFLKGGITSSNKGNDAGVSIIKLDENVYSVDFLKKQVDNALMSNISTIYIELLTTGGCKLKSQTMELFNPNAEYSSKDAVSFAEFNNVYEYADKLGVELVPVLDFSNKDNDKLVEFTGHSVFTVEGMRFYRALLKEACESTSVTTICLGKKVEDELIQKKYIAPLISIVNKYNKRAIAW